MYMFLYMYMNMYVYIYRYAHTHTYIHTHTHTHTTSIIVIIRIRIAVLILVIITMIVPFVGTITIVFMALQPLNEKNPFYCLCTPSFHASWDTVGDSSISGPALAFGCQLEFRARGLGFRV